MQSSNDIKKIQAFRAKVWRYYSAHARADLPWRTRRDPYHILVSEIMLQQTQVDRVIPKFKEFLCLFPTLSLLAQAPLSTVLHAWSGLGYNRRAKMLHEAARCILEKHNGRVPVAVGVLETLPGIGVYAARAIACFAYDEVLPMLETNIRTAVLHEFFRDAENVHDNDVAAVLEKVLVKRRAREWNWALMDYGAYLKKKYPNPSRKSAHHTKQSTFKGSNRELRGKILKALLVRGRRAGTLAHDFDEPLLRVESTLMQLEKDGLIKKHRGVWRCV